MSGNLDQKSLVGLHVDGSGILHTAWRQTGELREETTDDWKPFFWSLDSNTLSSGEVIELAGKGPWNRLSAFEDFKEFSAHLKDSENRRKIEVLKPYEHQVLIQKKWRLFNELSLVDLRRCQIDIETDCETDGGFSNAKSPGDRVLAIGLKMGDQVCLLELEENTDAAERRLLKQFAETLIEWDPDIIEGHNIFKFDLNYLKVRSARYRVKLAWGRFGAIATTRNSRIRIAERWIDFPRCEIPGRTVFDTYLMIQIFDLTKRDLPAYGLKEVALYFGISGTSEDDRTYIDGGNIAQTFISDRKRFREYLRDDLRETEAIADILLPTYLAQVQSFPILLQEASLRGTGAKVDLLFLDQYYHRKGALPEPMSAARFEGAFSKSFETGVYEKVLHFDVASLYPSLLLLIGLNPKGDDLGVFIPLLQNLREERLEYKRLARDAQSPEERREYNARQASYKILINSFYGYLGFGGARFGDGELAAEVTRRGRELLQDLIADFQSAGATVLEADTDGIYVSSEVFFDNPEDLLAKVSSKLPEGIALEFDGAYEAMFCYKAKNYALREGERIRIRGSALRSRGIEPYLKNLTQRLIEWLLKLHKESPEGLAQALETEIKSGDAAIDSLAKSEFLSQNPEAYKRHIESGGKPRRASLEVALNIEPQPRMGDRVTYFVGPKEKGQTSDWQRAFDVNRYNVLTCPYDSKYYIKKLNDWRKRYGEFL
ncbi:MAG: DNA polymerase domain-containing protein [Verrucomicrobiota bacterium]